MSDWQLIQLEQAINFGNGKVKPKNKGIFPIYGGNGILDFGDKFNYEGETIVIGRVGAYCGSVYYENKPIWVSDNALVAIPKKGFNAKFLFYFLKHSNLNQYAGGSSHPLVTQTLLNSLEFDCCVNPVLQERIAEVLSSLDDKIDLLHRQNKTLEEMAETLFRQWFVEEAGDCQANYSIYEYVTVDYGYPFNSKLFNDSKEGLPLIRIRDIKDGSMNTFTTEQADVKYLVEKGDLLVGMDGEFRIHMWRGDKAWLNQRVCRINPKTGIPDFFVFYLMKPHLDFYEQTKGGTTVIHLGKSDLDEIKIPFYPIEKIEKYKQISDPFFQKCKKNSAIINNLEFLRDTLLPKLMSGQIICSN
jgi:type I restriction enzyme S subunit